MRAGASQADMRSSPSACFSGRTYIGNAPAALHCQRWVAGRSGRRLSRLPQPQAPARPQERRPSATGRDAPGLTNAPPLDEAPPPAPARAPKPPQPKGPSQLKILYNRALRQLSTLELAIGELAVIAALCAIGTLVDQNESPEFYARAYPDNGSAPLWGLLTARVVRALQWDHIYTADYFLALLVLLAASLTACTLTRQWPAVKVARRWRFMDVKAIDKVEGAEVLPAARLGDLAAQLGSRGYQVFVKGPVLYAFKGLAGKLGPIGVHASLIAIMAGVAVGSLGGLKGSLMIPQGGQALVAAALAPASPLAGTPEGGKAVLQIDGFRISYRPDGSVEQFYSDISMRDLYSGQEVYKKTISVNDPLRFRGVTGYQTDWSIAYMDVRARGLPVDVAVGGEGGEIVLRLPMAEVQAQLAVNGKTWATFLPLEAPGEEGRAPKGITLLAQDFQSVVMYDSSGAFIGVRRPGSGKPLEVEGVSVAVEDIIGASGLELKVDPGVPYVYAGFGGLMLTTVVSYLSHSQVWAAAQGRDVHVVGRSNRDKVAFQQELSAVLDAVPEMADES